LQPIQHFPSSLCLKPALTSAKKLQPEIHQVEHLWELLAMHTRQVWVISIFLWLGCFLPSNAATPADPKVLHLLNRLSYGPRPGDIEKVTAMGAERYIQQQLHPEALAESPQLTTQLAQLRTLQMSPVELLGQYRLPARQGNQKQPKKEVQQANRVAARTIVEEAVQARLLRATQSDRQLQEVMVDFWFNHFNVFAGKGLTRLWVGSYEQDAIRPHALGRFRDLLAATAKHPAMLFYLDNWQNTAPNSAGARGRFNGLNENYARELMELHTLGVEGGYTQQDVITLAKILTGWGLQPRIRQMQGNQTGFYFDARRHDFSDKVFLGKPIKGSGIQEGEQALDILANHPATARYISYQLAQYFVADQPPKSLVDRLAQRFLATDGDIRAVLDTLFHSPEFWDGKYYNAKFKTPYQYVVSALRATDTPVSSTWLFQGALQQMGMPIYGCATPDGYKNTQEAWLNPDAMTRRLSLATALATGQILTPASALKTQKGAKPEISNLPISVSEKQPRWRAVNAVQLANTLGNRFSEKTQQAIATSTPQLRAALILGSPEFMRR
jgi:uncharacterized protein (DUF1800 family)